VWRRGWISHRERQDLCIVFVETPRQSDMIMTDISAQPPKQPTASFAPGRHGDNTFLGLSSSIPLTLGADLCLYSATSIFRLERHDRRVAIAKDPQLIQRIRSRAACSGTSCSPTKCGCSISALPPSRWRMNRQSKNAQRIAEQSPDARRSSA